jgi:hypothetical protein
VLTGCLINIDLCDVEKILFYDQESQATDNNKPELDVDNSDFSFVVFTLRSTLDSLFRLLKLVAGIDSMENELNQLFFILIDGNFFQSGLISSSSADELSLNKIICLDFVLYSSLSMVCDVTNLLGINLMSMKLTHLNKIINLKKQIKNLLKDRIIQATTSQTQLFGSI